MSPLPTPGPPAILVGRMRSLFSLALLCVGPVPALAQEVRPPGIPPDEAAVERVVGELRAAHRGNRANSRHAQGKGAEAKDPEELAREARRHEAERRTELLASAPRRFHAVDLDGNDWVSYREASALLDVSKSDFRAYDRDQDGRWTRDEFTARDRALLELLGATAAPIPELEELQRRREALEARREDQLPRAHVVVQPTPEPERAQSRGPLTEAAPKPPARSGSRARPRQPSPPEARATRPAIPAGLRLYPSPGQLLALFDQDSSRGLSEREVELVVEQAGGELSADLIVQQTDRDHSGELELAELGALSFFVSDRLSPALREQVERLSRAIPGSGAVEDPSEQTGPFGRLDVDGDGLLEARDLRALAGPYAVGIRFEAVLAALDHDGDGHVDRADFRAALRAPRRARSEQDAVTPSAPPAGGAGGAP